MKSVQLFEALISVFLLIPFAYSTAQWPTTPTEALFVDYGLYPCLAVDEQEESVIVIYIAGNNTLKAKKYDRYGLPLWGGQAVTLVDTALAFSMDLSNLSNQWGAVVSDDSGGAIVCWEDFRYSTFDPYGFPQNNEIYIQRVDDSGQVRYGANGKRISASAREGGHGLGDMKPDYHGGFVVGYSDPVDSLRSYCIRFGIGGQLLWEKIYDETFIDIDAVDNEGGVFLNILSSLPGSRAKLDINGNSFWPDSLVGIIPDDGEYRHGGAFPDKHGGVIGVGPSGFLRINRVDSTGQYVFGTNGIDLGQGQQVRIGYATDSSGGIYVGWSAVGGTKIQRISVRGDTVFNFPGINISPDSLPYGSEPYLVNDDENGVWGIWADSRHNPQDAFYAQRMDSLGRKIFPDSAIPFQITDGNTFFARPANPIISDLRGGFIFTWNEQQPGYGVRVFLKQISRNGNLGEVITAIGSDNNNQLLPKMIELKSIYPNPFNSTATISFSLPAASQVELAVYDILGRKVKTLFNQRQPAGSYTVRFEANDLPSGVYFYRLTSAGQQATRKMLLLR